MRKLTLGVAITALASLALVSSAGAFTPNSTSAVDGNLSIQGQPPGVFPALPATNAKKGGLYVETSTVRTSGGGTPTAPTLYPTVNGAGPAPSVYAEVNFDNDIIFTPPNSSGAKCSFSLSSATTQQALQLCGGQQVGSGVATLCAGLALAGFPNPGSDSCYIASNDGGSGLSPGAYQAVITAFTGQNSVAGDCNDGAVGVPTIILHGRNDALGITQQLVGCLEPAGSGALGPLGPDYAGGKVLTVKVPLVAGGAAAITDFATNINNNAEIKASCTDTDKTWNYQALITFANGAGLGSATPADTQLCPRKDPKA